MSVAKEVSIYKYGRGGPPHIQLLLFLLTKGCDIVDKLQAMGYTNAVQQLNSDVKQCPAELIVEVPSSAPVAQWTAPMMPVVAWNKAVNLCKDLKLTVRWDDKVAVVKALLVALLTEVLPDNERGSPAALYRKRTLLCDQKVSDATGKDIFGPLCQHAFYASDSVVLIMCDNKEGSWDETKLSPDVVPWIAPVLLVHKEGHRTIDAARAALQKRWPGPWSTAMLTTALKFIESAKTP